MQISNVRLRVAPRDRAAALSRRFRANRPRRRSPHAGVEGADARAVAVEVFQSERLVRGDGRLRLSVANVFGAAAAALQRGEAVEVREGDKVRRRCTPGDAGALADEFRDRGRSAAADAWDARWADAALGMPRRACLSQFCDAL